MKRRTLKKLTIAFLVPTALAIGAELYLRSKVPRCGVTPFRLSATPGLDSEFRPGFSTLYKGFEVSWNSDGYRGPEFPAKAEGKLRVALIGDSFVFGTAVDLPDTLAVRLEAESTDVQVLNFGVPGYNAEHVAAVLEADALAQDPDLVLYVFYNNDTNPPVHWKEIDPEGVIDGMHGFPAGSALLQWLNVRGKQLALRWFDWQLARATAEGAEKMWKLEGRARVEPPLRRMQALCAERDVRFVVVAYPMLTKVGNNPFRPVDEGMLELCGELSIEHYDLLAAFGDERDLTRYWASVFDTHPNGDANQLVAEHLAALLSGQ
ncbi:MAG: hypothetical protein O2816_08640 [Planctomycetota bacterium]|nr:hypothetical protein [Planctomycetota bacterium]